ncbi:hypothetical protein V3481_001108 [Fusarium oxysporum f. sp. vasinfectum]
MVPLRPVKNYSARGHVNAVLTESTFLSHRLVHHHRSQQTVKPLLEALNAESLQPPHRQPHTCSARSPHQPSSIRSRPQAYCADFAQRCKHQDQHHRLLTPRSVASTTTAQPALLLKQWTGWTRLHVLF